MTSTIVPPHDLDAERATLGSCLLSGDRAAAILEQVRDDDFYSETHQIIARAIREHVKHETPIDTITVAATLRTRGQLARIGGEGFLVALIVETPHAAQGLHYARLVSETARRRNIQTATLQAQNTIAKGDIDATLDQLAAALAANQARHDTERTPTTWKGIPLLTAADNDAAEPEPTDLLRADDFGLLYPGKVHDFHGEPEAGKGWIAVLASSQVLARGGTVVYFDFEDSANTLNQRLRMLGVDAEARNRLVYVHPDEALGQASEPDLADLRAAQPDLVILDGVNEAMSLQGLDGQTSNQDVAIWQKLIARKFSDDGATVVLIDHVAKATEHRGRYASGAGHKLAGVDVSFSVERVPDMAFAPGKSGRSRILIEKDRPGRLRAKAFDRRHIADLAMNEIGFLQLEIPEVATDSEGKPTGKTKRTYLMAKISDHLERTPFALPTRREITTALRGPRNTSATYIGEALDSLIADGYVEVNEGPRSSILHRLVKPYHDPERT